MSYKDPEQKRASSKRWYAKKKALAAGIAPAPSFSAPEKRLRVDPVT